MDGTPETLTDREVIDLITTSQEYQTYTLEDRARAEAQQAALIDRYREDKKEWERKTKLKARKTQGGLRDHWAELIARDGPPPKGLRIIPDSDQPHKVKVNRTLVLKRSEARRLARMERQRQLAKPTKPEKPWRKPIRNAEDMKAWT